MNNTIKLSLEELNRRQDELIKSKNYLLVSPAMMMCGLGKIDLDSGFKIYFIDVLYGEEILLTDKEGFDRLF